MAEKTVAMPDTHERATQPEGTWTRERAVTPPVDIYEMPEGLVVIAADGTLDLPASEALRAEPRGPVRMFHRKDYFGPLVETRR